MEVWLKTVLCVILLGLAGVVVFLAVQREKAALAVWEQLASRLGLDFAPAPSGWFRSGSAQVTGSHAGIPVKITRVMRGSGRSRHRCTRITAALRGRSTATVRVRRRGLINLPSLRGLPRIQSDSATDEPCVVWSDDAQAARALFDGDVSRMFQSFPRRAALDVAGAEATLEWRGTEGDPSVLEHGLELLARTARVAQGPI